MSAMISSSSSPILSFLLFRDLSTSPLFVVFLLLLLHFFKSTFSLPFCAPLPPLLSLLLPLLLCLFIAAAVSSSIELCAAAAPSTYCLILLFERTITLFKPSSFFGSQSFIELTSDALRCWVFLHLVYPFCYGDDGIDEITVPLVCHKALHTAPSVGNFKNYFVSPSNGKELFLIGSALNSVGNNTMQMYKTPVATGWVHTVEGASPLSKKLGSIKTSGQWKRLTSLGLMLSSRSSKVISLSELSAVDFSS